MDDSFLTDLASSMERLGFSSDDTILIEVGGAQTYEIDGAGTKWAPLKGHTNYNNDAFIVIKRKQKVISSIGQANDNSNTATATK